MARLTILLVALVAAMANAFVPVPLSRTGELNFLVVEVLESRFFGVEKEQWRRRRRFSGFLLFPCGCLHLRKSLLHHGSNSMVIFYGGLGTNLVHMLCSTFSAQGVGKKKNCCDNFSHKEVALCNYFHRLLGH
jgi:hypothetical protein